jgi:hypothetical protein
MRNLIAAIESAWQQITTNPSVGLPAPRSYPQMPGF